MKPSDIDRSITDSMQEPSSYTVAAEISLIIRAPNPASAGF
jgi:hypothetical protein